MERYGLPPQLKEGCVLFIPGVVNGTTIYDASGNSNHGTLVNSPTPTRGGLWGYEGLKFNGSNQYVQFPASAPWTNTGTFGFGCNFYTSTTNVEKDLFQKGDNGSGGEFGMLVRLQANGTAICHVVLTSGGQAMFSSGTVPYVANKWQHVFGYYDADRNKIGIYVDGVQSTETTPTKTGMRGNFGASIARFSSSYFAGTIANPIAYVSIPSKDRIELLQKSFFIP